MPRRIDGEWLQAINRNADLKGSIHDDEHARSLGLPHAVVGANQHLPMATRAAVEAFGSEWYERGFMKARLGRPVFDGERIRCVIEEIAPTALDVALFSLRIEKDVVAEPILVGYLGLARDAGVVPPWQRPGEPPTPAIGAHDPMPDVPLGTTYPSVRHAFPVAATRRSVLDEVGDTCRWYDGASPWGGPIVPSGGCIALSRAVPQPPVAGLRASMNAQFEIAHAGPVVCGRSYEVRVRLACKGFSGRTAFRTNETELFDGGRRVVAVRQMLRWFLPAAVRAA
jgi:hypothetical protein